VKLRLVGVAETVAVPAAVTVRATLTVVVPVAPPVPATVTVPG
jgi:hypothetical protein